MHGIYPLLCGAHRIVLASPVYFYGVTAQLKTLIDRCQAFWSRKYLLKNPLPNHLDGLERKGYLVSVAASSGKQVFDGVVLTARIFFDALNIAYGGDLLVRGVDAKGEIRDRVDDLEAAFKIGKELGAGKLP
jgi:multimeric flavodoxin WrbA